MTDIVAGSKAPDFTVKGLDGKDYSLRALLQKGPVVVAFFKISCPVCQFTFPFLERLYNRYGGEGVTFLGVSQDDDKATQSFAAQYGVTFSMALDDKRAYLASNAYGLTSVPTIFLIDTDGRVAVGGAGFNKQDLEAIAKHLAERRQIALAPLFSAKEQVPAHKPG
jgi:peroxiredoxin